MSTVLDCSVTLAWVYRDEITPAVSHVFDRLRLGEPGFQDFGDWRWITPYWRGFAGKDMVLIFATPP